MYAAERQAEITRLALRDGRVEVAELAGLFDVTTETIRRDLSALEAQGRVHRVHGGALPAERPQMEAGLAERAALMATEKERIAKAALAHLPERGSIVVDAGTTTAALAALIPDDRDLTVVTSSLPIGLTLAAHPRLTVLTIGGRVRGRTLAQVDRWALRSLSETNVDVAFMATNGLSLERGLSTPDLAEAAVKEAMIACADRVVLLADHTKVGVSCFARFGDLADVDVIVTDADLPAREARALRAAGPDVVRA